ncbi:MAG: 3-dehydroquinate synthase [Myxococcota bacterium]
MTLELQVALGPHSYPIVIDDAAPGALAAPLARRVLPPHARTLLVVSDTNVAPLYLGDLASALAAAGYAVRSHVLPAGEAHKDLAAVSAVVDATLGGGLTRHDALVALGGGVIGDITGFAAAIAHRGIAFLQVPTTLLAQVDSAVGGKTGVNHARGKNLIGAFWQPRAVASSQAVLRTLPAREVRGGMAEALKHGFIADPALVAWARANASQLAALDPSATAALVRACCRIKAAVVAEDEREDLADGRRAILNFGHTFGHAFESALGYGTLAHGEAVALGMVLAARLSERLGVASTGLEASIVEHLAATGLPCDPDAAHLPRLPALIDAAHGDKKADGQGGVRFVLLEAFGRPLLRRLSWREISAALGAPWP